MLKRTLFKKSLLAFAAASALFSQTTLAAPGDFDADGTSDLSVTLVDRNAGTTAWLTRLTNGSTPLFWTFNKAADAFAIGRFYSGNSRYYPAIVRVTSASQPLEWTFKTAANTEIENRFGLPGDTITNLGDWDGDGREDLHVVRAEGTDQELQWYVFLTGYATIVKVPFGLRGDQVGVADIDNDGQVELVALRNGFTWFTRKPFVDRNQTTAVQWGLSGDRPLLPRDIDGDNRADYIITRVVGGNQVAYIRYATGQSETRVLGQASSIPQVGDFGSNAKFAWSQRDTGFTAIGRPDGNSPDVFRFGIATNAIVRPDGTVVQANATATFPDSTTDETPPSNGGGSEAGSFDQCSQVLSVPGGGTFIYKNSAPIRSGGVGTPLVGFRIEPTLIMNRNVSNRSTSTVYDSRGNVLTRCPWATAHGHAGGRMRCTINTTAMVRQAVRNTGSPTVYFSLTPNSCAKVDHGGKCYGSVKGRCNETFQ